MIQINNLRKSYKGFTLEIENFKVGRGDYVVILGNSGSGKTMLLELMAGLIKSEEGTIVMDGEDLNLLSIQDRPFGLVFQDQALFPHMTVEENVKFGFTGLGLTKNQKEKKYKDIVRVMEIGYLTERYPKSLSGGEKQRVALARALVREPACLLLDEPLSALDTKLRKEIRSVLRWLNRQGHTILHVTHDFEEAVNVASHIAVIEKGELIQYGTSEKVLKEPRSSFVANFTGIRNYFPVTLDKSKDSEQIVAYVDNRVPVHLSTDKSHGTGYIIIPGESLLLSRSKIETSAANQFKGVIEDISTGRFGVEIQVNADLPLVAQITKNSKDKMDLKIGQEIWVNFKATSVRFIRK